MGSVITIATLGDNFTYLYEYEQHKALVVDPSNSSSIFRILEQHDLTLTTVLVTHHHWDHVAGAAELKKKVGCRVIGSDKERIRDIDTIVDDGDVARLGNTEVRVIGTPGHTLTAVCYYIGASKNKQGGILWTGDTLFIGGCGRLLECDAKTMWDSLGKLASLPDETLVYCGHDYTVENYEFALTIEPNNETVKQRLVEVRQAQSQGSHTVPSTILQEKRTNPFLRADTPELKAAVNMPAAGAEEVFAELRQRKDVF